jgi:hypothetical protein
VAPGAAVVKKVHAQTKSGLMCCYRIRSRTEPYFDQLMEKNYYEFGSA